MQRVKGNPAPAAVAATGDRAKQVKREDKHSRPKLQSNNLLRALSALYGNKEGRE